jgi:F-box protein 11
LQWQADEGRKMRKRQPVAFMSYVRFDDEHENGRLTEFRERLSAEVKMQTGEEFPIFQDRNDIKWGQNWKERLEETIDEVTFLIPIITPTFFKSKYCYEELERFIEREKELDRNDLILPVYYVSSKLLDDEEKRASDKLATLLASRQFMDWRDLRFEPFTLPEVGKRMAKLALQICDALERVQEKKMEKPQDRKRKLSGALEQEISEPAREMSEATSKSIARTEPPTRVVDQMYRGDHTTITEAIKVAKPGDRILIRPGLYKEGLVVDKPVEIIGDGDMSEVIIEATGKDVLIFNTTMGRVSNLTMRQIGGGNYFGVDIAQGRLELEGCDITSESLPCVGIHGGADPRLRRNRIHDGKEGGVSVYENGQGTLEDNDIFGNALAGISIGEEGNPTLRRNRIHDGESSGVLVYENGQGTLEDNDIFGNAYAGVEIREGGNPTLHRNRINKNNYQAVWIYNGGGGIIEDNDLRNNAKGAWDISEDSKPLVKRARNLE